MYISCDTNTKPNYSDEQNQILNNNSDGHHNRLDTQQDNVGVNNTMLPSIEHLPKGQRSSTCMCRC